MSPALPTNATLASACLRPIAPDEVHHLANALAAMSPWSALEISADDLARFLNKEDRSAQRYAITADGDLAGAFSLRFPWLKGPYIELLALLPNYQGKGLGTDVLSFVEKEANRIGERNIWVCASQFNSAALRFYKRKGFVEVGLLPDLVAVGFAEVLLRKPLT